MDVLVLIHHQEIFLNLQVQYILHNLNYLIIKVIDQISFEKF